MTTVLLIGAGRAAYAQSASAQPGTGTLNGKLTDVHSAPLGGVEVVVRNQATGAEMRTTTARNGGYRFTGLAAGIYTLTAESSRLGRGQVGGIEIDAGQEARVQAAIEFEPLPPPPVQMASHPSESVMPVSATLAAEPAQLLPLTEQPAETPETVKANGPIPAAEIHPVAAPEAVAKNGSGARARVKASGHAGAAPIVLAGRAVRAATQAAANPFVSSAVRAARSETANSHAEATTLSDKTAIPAGKSAERAAAQPETNVTAKDSAARSASEPEPKPDAGAPGKAVEQAAEKPAANAAAQGQINAKAQPAANPSARLKENPAMSPHPAMTPEAGSAELRVGELAGAGPSSLGLPGAAISEAAMRIVQSAMVLSRSPALRTQTITEQADSASQAATTTMSSAELQALPSSGRHWQDFLLDAPTATARQGGLGEIALRGAGQEQADTTLDRTSTTLAFGTQGSREQANGEEGASERSGLEQTQGGGRGFAVAQAAIRTVRTEAGNVEAEGARAAGGRVDVETESGGRKLHGQGFLFDRQNLWGARNPFSQWVTETTPAAFTGLLPTVPVFDNGFGSSQNGLPESYTPPDREISWGIGAGGPIRRDKLFWFGAVDSYRSNDPVLSMVKHPYLVQNSNNCVPTPSNPCTKTTGFFAQPTDCEMQVLSARLGFKPPGTPGPFEPQDCVSGLVYGVTAYSSMLETLAGLLGPAPRTATQWVGFGRVDWQAAERHRLVLEASGADWNSPGGGMSGLTETYGNHSFGNGAASQAWLMGRWEAYLTPNLLAVTQGSVGRAIASRHASTPSAFEQTFLTGSPSGQLPQIGVDSRYGFTIGTPARFGSGSYPDERIYQAQETLSWVHGRTLVNTGFEVSHNADMTSVLRNQAGTFSYSNVENFASDALVFEKYGLSALLSAGPLNQTTVAGPYGCDQTGKVWVDSSGTVRGTGYLPCYSYYSQTMGPSDWHLSTNDWSGFVNAQWRAGKQAVFSAGLRWDREQLPPVIAALWPPPPIPNSPSGTLPPETLPSLGNNWAPRFGLALGGSGGQSLGWPVLRLGYGLYYGRTENATIETALTQTGSPNGDRYYFIRPTDGYNPFTGRSDAPIFPDVLSGTPASEIKPTAVEFAPNFRNPEVHQAVVSVEEALPGQMSVTASGMVSLGRRLPITIDTNLATPTQAQTITYTVVDGTGAGPIKAPQITVPFYASWPGSTGTAGRLNPNYQQIDQIMSRANSTYEALMLRVIRSGRRGLNLMAYYTYAHAMDWNPNESTLVAGSDVLDPADFKQEYGTSDLDVRHSVSAYVIYEAPWKLHDLAGKLANGWMISAIGRFHSGLPFTMRTSGSLPEEFDSEGNANVGLGPGMNGSGGDNRVYWLGNNNQVYTTGRNTFRYPPVWKADMRLGKRFNLGETRELELLAESFNLFNHQNVTRIETTGYTIESGSPPATLGAPATPPTLNFLTGQVVNESGAIKNANTTGFGQPLSINGTNFYRPRQFQFGMQFTF